ncbi:MAG TPA: AsnC family transcriptional regulator [Candidatus Hydrogenedentes bacterium]|nr:AsnC family transcriptional regulator [Candidatus Hydrogenedentota bacterium]HOL77161.1 AsnC family transcriptional regulator [Candidatus Hydrogenedentota bacterium]HPO85900.1 AsnC family transcriptional regulator [Candidatus Hydrogenedentota bacterium]
MSTIDDIDRRILDRIQQDFPIVSRPFAELGRHIGISEIETITRLQRLQEKGIIRQIGGVFELRQTGHVSTLCAATVDADHLDDVVKVVNAYSEVTHNYLREHTFNLWFTVIAPSRQRLEKIIEHIRNTEGVKQLLDLPAERVYKIRVNFAATIEETE